MNKLTRQVLGIILSTLFLMACEDKHQEVFEDPEWYGGTIHETLEKNGNFNHMLKLITKSGYDEAIEKGMFTIFCADDDAFEEFFKKEGIDSIGDLSEYEALQLIELVILNTPRTRIQLIYDYLMGIWQEDGSETGALVFRWPTRSKARIGIDTSLYFESTDIALGDAVHIYGQDKYVPLLSTEYMKDYVGQSSDYTYFFPETKWSGFQWYNANIDSSEIRCSNGYLYFLDKVVPEIPSIEEHLRKNQDKYGLFYKLAQRFAEYSFQETDDDDVRLYTKTYTNITNIAGEVGPYPGHPIYTRKQIYSAFIPRNEVLQDYLDKTILQHFEDIDSVPNVTITYLLQSHITTHFDLVSKMRKVWYNYYGDDMPINPEEDFVSGTLLSNGAFYEVNRVIEPLAFTTVCGPLFFNADYTTFLQILNRASGVLPALGRPDVFVTVLAPNDESMEKFGVRYNKLNDIVEYLTVDSVWENLEVRNPELLTEIARNHFIFGHLEDFMGKGVQEMNSLTLLEFENNKLIAGGNQELGDDIEIDEIIDSKVNGNLMLIDNVIKTPWYDIINRMEMDPDCSEFLNLCYQANLIDTVESVELGRDILSLSFMTSALEWTAFIPNNDAVLAAKTAGQLPPESDTLGLLENIIRYHFVGEYSLHDYMEENDAYETIFYNDSTKSNATLDINISTESIQITDLLENTVTVAHNNANNFAKDGVFHKISSVLRYKE